MGRHVPLRDRTLAKIAIPATPDACWEWTASRDGHGYGQIGSGTKGKILRAHRVTYELWNGSIPMEDGHGRKFDLDHLCRNRACVRPDHLEPVTRGENVRRGLASVVNRERAASITHCPQGHEYSEANTDRQPTRYGGISRSCRTCKRERKRARRARAKALAGTELYRASGEDGE